MFTGKGETAHSGRCVEIRNLRSKAKRREERFVYYLSPAADENIGGRVRTMNKLKIAGIIISIVAASVFVFLYFGRPHTVINAILVLLAGGVAVLGLMMVSVVEEINLEDTNDEK